MKLPEFFYVKAFWASLSLAVSGVLGLLYLFGVVSVEWAVAPAVILQWALSVLQLFNIKPELMQRKVLLAKAKKSK